MSNPTDRERFSLMGRIGGPASWARTSDWSARTAPARAAARAALDLRLAEQHKIPLDGSPGSAKRLEAARRAHYQRLALKARKQRAKRPSTGRS